MLTQREVIEISERAMGHQALVEKYNDFIQQCNDPQVRDLIQQHQQILQRHHQTLVNLLNDSQNYVQQNVRPQTTTTMV